MSSRKLLITLAHQGPVSKHAVGKGALDGGGVRVPGKARQSGFWTDEDACHRTSETVSCLDYPGPSPAMFTPPRLAPQSCLAAKRATQLPPKQPFPKRLGAAGQGRKEAGPGAPRVKPRRPGTQEPGSSPHPVPAQPLCGFLVHSRVLARVTDSRSWCRCRRCCCCRRHPAAATTGCRRLGHPSGRAGRGRRQRRRHRACWKWTAALPGSRRLVLSGAPPSSRARLRGMSGSKCDRRPPSPSLLGIPKTLQRASRVRRCPSCLGCWAFESRALRRWPIAVK